jgi:hypothetical protein
LKATLRLSRHSSTSSAADRLLFGAQFDVDRYFGSCHGFRLSFGARKHGVARGLNQMIDLDRRGSQERDAEAAGRQAVQQG